MQSDAVAGSGGSAKKKLEVATSAKIAANAAGSSEYGQALSPAPNGEAGDVPPTPGTPSQSLNVDGPPLTPALTVSDTSGAPSPAGGARARSRFSPANSPGPHGRGNGPRSRSGRGRGARRGGGRSVPVVASGGVAAAAAGAAAGAAAAAALFGGGSKDRSPAGYSPNNSVAGSSSLNHSYAPSPSTTVNSTMSSHSNSPAPSDGNAAGESGGNDAANN